MLSASAEPALSQEFTLDSKNFTTPSWTRLTRLMAEMQDASQPYSINMIVNGDPRTQMGFAWFTNPEVKSGKV